MLKLFSNLSQKYIYGPLKKFPGEQTFGLYRFLPFFFLFGASLEYLMCNLKAGPAQVNFCRNSAPELISHKIQKNDHTFIQARSEQRISVHQHQSPIRQSKLSGNSMQNHKTINLYRMIKMFVS